MEPQLADELLQRGFLCRTSSAAPSHIRRMLLQDSWYVAAIEAGRVYQADAEDMAEGGIGSFLRSLAPFLTGEGVALPEVSDQLDVEYVVRVGNDAVTVYSRNEVVAEDSHPGLLWGLATSRSFRVVNLLLQDARSPERLFAVNAGNDLSAVFLSPVLHTLILRDASWPARERPYVPTEEYPWFGQLH